MPRVHVAQLSELAPGDMQPVDFDGVEVLLARVGDTVYAVDNLCSHAEGWLDMGHLYPATCEIGCPLHDGKFDLRTGAATHEPATEPVKTYRVEVDGDDVFLSTGQGSAPEVVENAESIS